ncbi:MAG TPA: tetratricopeptide repeat protein [Opitutaceae bacterium]
MKAFVLALAITLGALWIYGPSLGGTWLWDDGLEIHQNPALRSPDGWWRPWVHPEGMDYFPLKSTLQWIEWRLWGDQTAPYRWVSLGLHVLSSLLVWRLLARLGVRSAFLGGILFAVHPMAVESVAWISEFKNTVSLPPLLLAAIAYVDFDRTGSRWAHRRSLAWFVAALACKTSIVAFPAVILVFAWWKRGRIRKRDLRRSGPFWAAAVLLGAATLWFQTHRAIGLAGTPTGLGTRLAQAGCSLAAYVRYSIWPVGLEPIYPWARQPGLGWIGWLGAAALLGFFWWRRGGWGRHAVLGAAWFLLFLAPVLGILPMAYSRIAPMADHFAYVSLVGVVGVAAAAWDGLRRLCAERLKPAALAWAMPAGLAGAVLVALAAGAHAYASDFANEKALWSVAVQRNPGAWLAHNNLGKVFLQENRPSEAADQFRRATTLQPDSPEAHANLGNALEALGSRDDARREYEAALAIDPRFAGARYNLGLWFLKAGRPDEAAAAFRAALAVDPAHASAHNNLGLSLAATGHPAEALEEYRRALALDPNLPEAHLNLGNALFRSGRLPEAVVEYREALRIAPEYAAAHANLAVALGQLGQGPEAEAELERARQAAHR